MSQNEFSHRLLFSCLNLVTDKSRVFKLQPKMLSSSQIAGFLICNIS